MAKRRGTKASAGLPALELGKRLQETDRRACYLLVGGERYLERTAVSSLRQAIYGSDEESPAESQFDGGQTELAHVLDEVRTLPFFGEHRLVIVNDPGGNQGFLARHGEDLAQFLKAPPGTATLVIAVSKLDGRLKSTKALLATAVRVDCAPFDEASRLAFVRARAKEQGKAFERRIDMAFLERLGDDVALATLDTEIKKLAEAAQGDAISLEDVETLVAPGSSEQAFGLIDAMGQGDLGRALSLLHTIFRDGLITAGGARTKDASGIAMILLPTLRWDLGRLLRAHSLLAGGMPPHQVTREVRVFRDKQAFLQRVRTATRSELVARWKLLREADAGLRSSADPQFTLLQVVGHLALRDRPERTRALAGAR